MCQRCKPVKKGRQLWKLAGKQGDIYGDDESASWAVFGTVLCQG